MKYLRPAEVSKAYMNRLVGRTMGAPPPSIEGTEQHYGFEVEIEGRGCADRAARLNTAYWRPVRDQSLRGESIETIFRRPLTMAQSLAAFDSFEREFAGFGTGEMSDRTSVHVHYDVNRRKMSDLQKMLVGFYFLENLLFRQGGGVAREGNRFCLRTCDSEAPLTALIKGFQAGDVRGFTRGTNQTSRYSNLNLQALMKFGSLEVRCHRGTTNPVEMRKWLAVIDEVFTVSRSFKQPREILEMSSEMGTIPFLLEYYPLTAAYTAGLGDQREALIYDGIDYAQMLAYSVEVVSSPGKKLPARSGGPLGRGNRFVRR